MTATTSKIQPTIKATPPNGVIIPSFVIPVKLKTYRLPENKI